MEKCGFCGKTVRSKYVEKLIKAPNDDFYICNRCVDKCCDILNDMQIKIEDDDLTDTVKTNNYKNQKPSQIHNMLNTQIIGQERAKKVLSVAIYNHMKRLKDSTGLIKKSNILMIGPSGSGKTLLAKTIADVLDVPFTIADATSFTEAGYVGDDVETCLQRLLIASNYDVKRAEQGIIYIDEIDKIARSGGNKSITRDVSGEGVQASLLKLIEGCEVSVPVENSRKHPNGNNIMINTNNILFICGGAFDGIIEENDAKKSIGFNSVVESLIPSDNITTDKVIKYGMMPEFIGRLSTLCLLDELTQDDLVKVLTEPQNAITKEYIELFKQEGIELIFEPEALKMIANKSIDNKTGARGLRSILEDIMLDLMYDVPDNNKIKSIVINKAFIETKQPYFEYKAKIS